MESHVLSVDQAIAWSDREYWTGIEESQRVYVWKMWYVESMDTSRVTKDDIHRIYEIEQDMWSHGTWLYISCDNCGEISSKSDIYGHLAKDIQLEIVSNLEKIYDTGCPDCPKCQSKDTKHIYDESYKQEIAWRYEFDESFLTVFRDVSWKIQGFCNAYISDFDTIYTREFDPYYITSLKDGISRKISDIWWFSVSDRMLTLNTLGTTQSYWSMTIIYYILKGIMNNIHIYHSDIPMIFDVILGTVMHKLYLILWWKHLYVSAYAKEGSVNECFQTDILCWILTPDVLLSKLWKSSQTFIKHNIKNLRA